MDTLKSHENSKYNLSVCMIYVFLENYVHIKLQNILCDLYFNIKLNSGVNYK